MVRGNVSHCMVNSMETSVNVGQQRIMPPVAAFKASPLLVTANTEPCTAALGFALLL